MNTCTQHIHAHLDTAGWIVMAVIAGLLIASLVLILELLYSTRHRP